MKCDNLSKSIGNVVLYGVSLLLSENRISHRVLTWHNEEHLLDVNVKNIGVMHSVERFLNENKPLQTAFTLPLTVELVELSTEVWQCLTCKVQFFWSARLT